MYFRLMLVFKQLILDIIYLRFSVLFSKLMLIWTETRHFLYTRNTFYFRRKVNNFQSFDFDFWHHLMILIFSVCQVQYFWRLRLVMHLETHAALTVFV